MYYNTVTCVSYIDVHSSNILHWLSIIFTDYSRLHLFVRDRPALTWHSYKKGKWLHYTCHSQNWYLKTVTSLCLKTTVFVWRSRTQRPTTSSLAYSKIFCYLIEDSLSPAVSESGISLTMNICWQMSVVSMCQYVATVSQLLARRSIST